MLKLVQSRTGDTGTCFRTCLASLLNLQESGVPDFPDANEDPYVNTFLAKHGLHYEEIPYDAEQPPVGEHLILGISPRGGMHAVVGVDGVVKMDPHPMDGTGRGLVEPLKYGVLTRMKGEARDGVTWKPSEAVAEWKRLMSSKTKYGELLRKADEDIRRTGKVNAVTEVALTKAKRLYEHYEGRVTPRIKADAEGIRRAKDMSGYGYGMGKHCHLCGTPIDNGQKVNECQACRLEKHYEGRVTPRVKADAEGIRKALRKAAAKDASLRGEALGTAARALKSKHDEMWTLPTRGAVGEQTAYASMATPVADLLREAEALLRSTRISDKAKWLAKLETGKKLVARGKAAAAKGDYASAAWCVDSALSSAHYIIDALRALARRTGAKDMSITVSQIIKHDIDKVLDTIGITAAEFQRRTPAQRRSLLETAYKELERLSKSSKKGGSVVARAKDDLGWGMQEVSARLERLNTSNGKCKECNKPLKAHSDLQLQDCYTKSLSHKATDSRRARLHRALDAVMDSRSGAKDGAGNTPIEKRVIRLYESGVNQYDIPRKIGNSMTAAYVKEILTESGAQRKSK